jgi:hypothetical protein
VARGHCTFRQRDIKAAIKAVIAAGVGVARVEIGNDGRIVVIASSVGAMPSTPDRNDLDRELADFEARNGQGRA